MATELLTQLGHDPADPSVVAAVEDAEELADLVASLVRIRRDRGLRQTDVAGLLGVSQSVVSDFERLGGDPRLSTVQRYARALGVRIRLFALDGDETRPLGEVTA
jgi:transcriptional regulator with XRE-family HTH domain